MTLPKGRARQIKENTRLEFVKADLLRKGYKVFYYDYQEKALSFRRQSGAMVKYWPFTEYYNGKGIKPGRGYFNLLNELEIVGEKFR